MTKAEIRANAYADMARSYGLEASVKVEHEDATLYSDGEVMLPARTLVWLTIKETDVGFYGDTLTAGWQSRHSSPNHNASTKFLGGRKSALLVKDRKFPSERRFANRLSIYNRQA